MPVIPWATTAQTVEDYFDYRPKYGAYWSTTSSSTTYSYAYSTIPVKSRTAISNGFLERVKPDPEPASEAELRDFLFGGKDG